MIVFGFLAFSARAEIYNYHLVPDDIAGSFHQGVIAFEKGDADKAFKYLDKALALCVQYDIRNLPAYGASLVRLAVKYRAQPEVQNKLLAYSRYFAPKSSELYFMRARIFLSQANLQDGLGELKAGIKALKYDFPSWLWLRSFGLFVVANWIKLLVGIFSLMIIARGGRMAVHWFVELFPDKFRRSAFVLALIIFFAPFYFGLGAWSVFIWIGVLCAVFLNQRVQIIYWILLACFCFEIGISQKSTELLELASYENALDEFRIGMGMVAKEDLNKLRARAGGGSSSAFILAWAEAERRAGNYSASAELLLKLINHPQAGAYAYNNLACLYIDFSEFDQAKEALERAEPMKDVPVEALYNLSQVLSQLREFDASDTAYKKAVAMNEGEVERFDFLKELVREPIIGFRSSIPNFLLKKEAGFQKGFAELLMQAKFRFAILLIGILLTIFLRKRLKMGICFYCGGIICPNCLAESRIKGVCQACYQAFVSGKALDPKAKMLQRSKARRYHQITGGASVVLNLLFPGSAFIFEERAGIGLVFMVFPLAFLSLLLARWGFVPSLISISLGFPWWILIGGGIYFLFALVALILYFKLFSVEL